MKRINSKKILIILLTIIFDFYFINAEAKDINSYDTYQGAKDFCERIDNSTYKDAKEKEKACTSVGCSYNKSDAKCYAQLCDNVSGCNASYCSFSQLPAEAGTCHENKTCEQYGNIPHEDDFHNVCSGDVSNTDIRILLTRDEYYNTDDNKKLCNILYNYRNSSQSISGEKKLCKAAYGENTSGYNICMNLGASLSSVYIGACTSTTKTCGDNQYSYKVKNAQYSGYECACISGYTLLNGVCAKTGGGSGTKTCPENYNYVANGYNKNTCANDSCKMADCYLNGGIDGSAKPYAKDEKNKFVTSVSDIMNGSKRIDYYDKAYRYYGYCASKDKNHKTDVFCLDPGASYHDNNASYKCDAALNPNGTTDKGYIKIYQLAIGLYQDAFSKITGDNEDAINNDQYQALNFSFRFWTFYSNMGKFNTKDAHLMNIANGFDGTSRKIINDNDNGYYFKVYKNGINGATIKGTTSSAGNAGYKDSVYLFETAAKNINDIWTHDLKFTSVPSSDGKTAEVTLSGIQSLREDGFREWNFANTITCESNCRIISALPNSTNFVRDNIDNITFTISIDNPNADYTLQVLYYDRRDAKNIVLATSAQNEDYQRLLFVAQEPRDFIYQETFGKQTKTCRVYNGKYYGIDGREITGETNTEKRTKYLSECCAYVPTYKKDFCNISGNDAYCKGDITTWVKNGCKTACTPNNTTDKCNVEEKNNKDIVISDLTNGNDAGLTYDDYCYGCTSTNSTDLDNNSYVVKTNAYCSVMCIEEYKFNVPTNLSVQTQNNSKYGRYLNLTVKANSKRVCYTDPKNPINYNQFVKDISGLPQQINSTIIELNEYIAEIEKLRKDNSVIVEGTNRCDKASTNRCEAGQTYGTAKCKNSCEKCTAEKDGGCIASVCVAPNKDYTPGCEGTSKKFSYTYKGTEYVSACGCDTNTCTGKNDCSKDGVIKELENKKNEIKATLDDLVKKYRNIISEYNSCSQLDKYYGSCYNGKSGTAAPYIEYTYAETEYMNIMNGQNNLIGSWNSTGTKTDYYNSSSTIEASCGFKDNYPNSNVVNVVINGYTYPEYNEKNGTYETGAPIKVDRNNYVKTVFEYAATLTPQAYWYTNQKNGEASINKPTKNYLDLGNVLPISKNCTSKSNPYHYTLTFKNIGQYSDRCELGRLEKVISKMEYTNKTDPSGAKQGKYSCDYKVDDKSCEGCETTYYFKPISLNDVFPNSGSGLASNPNYREDVSPNKSGLSYEVEPGPIWTTQKGKDTQKAIEQAGNEIYNNNKESLQYSYTLTPAGMKKIREYNKNTNYGDFNMDCRNSADVDYNYQGTCVSEFLNDIASGKYSGVKELKRNTYFVKYPGDGSFWK